MSEIVLQQEKPARKVGIFEKRIHEIDFLRGLLILLVVFDHILNCILLHSKNWADWVPQNQAFLELYKAMDWYWECEARRLIRYIALFLFCFVSGISSQFSRNNWKRMAELIVVWGLLLVGGRLIETFHWLGDTASRIDFNIIGVLAFSTLFYCFVQNCSWKGILASTLIWFLISCYILPRLEASPGSHDVYNPVLWDGIQDFTGDWMPLFPYIVFFFAGALFSYFFYAQKQSYFKRYEFERPICFVGRNTIWIYLGHQVVFIPLFMLVDVIIKACYGLL